MFNLIFADVIMVIGRVFPPMCDPFIAAPCIAVGILLKKRVMAIPAGFLLGAMIQLSTHLLLHDLEYGIGLFSTESTVFFSGCAGTLWAFSSNFIRGKIISKKNLPPQYVDCRKTDY